MGGAQGGRTAWACSHAQGGIPVVDRCNSHGDADSGGNGNMHEEDMG